MNCTNYRNKIIKYIQEYIIFINADVNINHRQQKWGQGPAATAWPATRRTESETGNESNLLLVFF